MANTNHILGNYLHEVKKTSCQVLTVAEYSKAKYIIREASLNRPKHHLHEPGDGPRGT